MPAETQTAAAADPPEFIGTGEARKRLGVSARTLRRCLAEGLLESFKVRGHLRIPAAAVEALRTGKKAN